MSLFMCFVFSPTDREDQAILCTWVSTGCGHCIFEFDYIYVELRPEQSMWSRYKSMWLWLDVAFQGLQIWKSCRFWPFWHCRRPRGWGSLAVTVSPAPPSHGTERTACQWGNITYRTLQLKAQHQPSISIWLQPNNHTLLQKHIRIDFTKLRLTTDKKQAF